MFNKNARSKNALLASSAGMLNQFVQIIGNFVYRTIFLHVLTAEYLGINGLFTNILQVFSLAELGIGSAILYNMYGAFANQDTKKIGQLVHFYKRIYTILALIVLGIGLAFYPFLSTIVRVEELPSDVSLTAVYFLFVLNSVASYLFVYKQSLLSADQKEHLVQLFQVLVIVLGYVIKIILLYACRDYVTILASGIVLTLLLNWIFSLWITNRYRSIFEESSRLPQEEKKEIYKSTRGLMCHKIGYVIVTSTDSIVISKYVSLLAVGLYSNYGTIVSSITRLGVSLINGMLPSIANYTVNAPKKDAYRTMKKILFANMWLASLTTICLYCLLNPFIVCWLGENFLLSQAVVAVVCLQHYMQTARLTVNNFVYSAGLFMRDKIRPLIESALNLVISIILAKHYGIIGVFIGTCVSGLLTYFWREPYLLFKNYFCFSSFGYWWIQFRWLVLTAALCYGMQWLFTLLPGGWLWLIVRFGLAALIPNVVILLLHLPSDEFKYFFAFLKRKFLRR